MMNQTVSDAWTQLKRASIGRGEVDLWRFAKGSSRESRKLSKREAMLLKLLIGREGEVVSREDILQMVWGYDIMPSTRTIDNFILAFRKPSNRTPKTPNISIPSAEWGTSLSRKILWDRFLRIEKTE